MIRTKLILGGFEQWVEYNERLCCITIFGFETAKHGLVLDVMGVKGNAYVSGSAPTEQEKKELNNYINNLELSK
jgi:hypothetical protein